MNALVIPRCRLLTWIAVLFLASQPSLSMAAESEATVIQPERDFAYTLGDVLVQRIVLPESKAQPDLSVLDSAARVSDWLDRQEATLQQVDQQPVLQLRYQIVNAPESILITELPALSVSLSDGNTIKWPAWPFSLGPLIASEAVASDIQNGQRVVLKADEQLASIDTQKRQLRLFQAVAIMAATLVSWCVWWLWRTQRERHRLPFARAVHELKRQRVGSDPETLAAWQIVHEAFNASAGQVITRSDLALLTQHLPWIGALGVQVDEFFAESSARFFAQPPESRPFDLSAFAQRLATEEKRHAV